MKGGGYLSQDEVIREALRVYELVEQEDNDPQLEAALRHSLRSPLKKYKPGHFACPLPLEQGSKFSSVTTPNWMRSVTSNTSAKTILKPRWLS